MSNELYGGTVDLEVLCVVRGRAIVEGRRVGADLAAHVCPIGFEEVRIAVAEPDAEGDGGVDFEVEVLPLLLDASDDFSRESFREKFGSGRHVEDQGDDTVLCGEGCVALTLDASNIGSQLGRHPTVKSITQSPAASGSIEASVIL